MFSQVYEPKGYRFTFLSASEIEAGLEEHLDESTRIVWLETPTNPLLNLIDIEKAAKAAHAVGRDGRRRLDVRDARFSSARTSWAPTSSSTRPRSTSAGTRT